MWVADLNEGGIKPGFNGEKSPMNMWLTAVCEILLSCFSTCLFSDLRYRITNHGSLLYVKTNLDAPQHKVVTVDLSKDEPEIRDFIPEVKDAKLVQANCVNEEYFVAIYKRNVIPLAIRF
jgi:protease II